jgi:uncharacterized membrane protein YfhO
MCVVENPDAPAGASLFAATGADLDATPLAAAGTIGAVDLSTTRATYRVVSTDAAIVVRSTRAYPGWRVSVDGQPRTAAVAFAALQAAAVPAGASTLSFTYVPLSLTLGLALSALAVVVSGLLWWRR